MRARLVKKIIGLGTNQVLPVLQAISVFYLYFISIIVTMVIHVSCCFLLSDLVHVMTFPSSHQVMELGKKLTSCLVAVS